MPASQHQNGAAEILIKMVKGVKVAMMKALGLQVLSLNEMSTLMMEIAQLVNERPIGLKPNESTHPHYLSPNSLYLGRCSDRIAGGPFQANEVFTDDPKKTTCRFLLVQSITRSFGRSGFVTSFQACWCDKSGTCVRETLGRKISVC